MAKTLVDIDDELLARAQEFMGARKKKDTVNGALSEYVKLQLRLRHREHMSGPDAPDPLDPAV